MNTLTRWNPFREMDELQTQLAPLFGRWPAPAGQGKETMTVAQWSPLVDIAEDDKEWLIKAELPEVTKDQIKVSVEAGGRAIAGERKFEKEEKDRKYHRVERAYGSFLRSFTLPEGADGSKVAAEFRDGVIQVHLPKSEKVKPKAVELKVQ